jgi:hypothetical protein
MAVFRCRHCRVPIEWLTVKGGKRMLFDHELVAVDQAPADNQWSVIRADGGRAVVIPVARPGATRVLLRHVCAAKGHPTG